MSVCLFVCLFVRHTFSLCLTVFGPLFPKSNVPTFWSQIWKLMLIKGVKSSPQKKVFYRFFYLFPPFKSFFAPTSKSPLSKLLRFLESLGKSNGQKWSQMWKLLLIKGVQAPRKIGREILYILYGGFLLHVYPYFLLFWVVIRLILQNMS